MTARSDAAGTAAYGYDGGGRLKTIDDAVTGTRLTLSYTKLSQVGTVAYGDNGNVRSFGYDPLSVPISGGSYRHFGALAPGADDGPLVLGDRRA